MHIVTLESRNPKSKILTCATRRSALAGETDLTRLVKHGVFGIGARTIKFGQLLPPERLTVDTFPVPSHRGI